MRGFRHGIEGLFLAVAAMLLAACSAGVSAPETTPAPGTITVTPSSATAFSELPTSFVVSGGTGPYFVTSSNQAIVPVVGTVSGNSFSIVPNQVGTETPVTLTVRDSANSPAVNVGLTVRPRTISNVVSVTPSASQPAACGTSICAGGDAEVSTTLSQNGVALVGRTVRFDVVSGDFRAIVSAPGTAELLATSATTTTDSAGTARFRVRVLNDAVAQTGLADVTDVNSGFRQRITIPIAPGSSSPLNAQPSQISFIGSTPGTCAQGVSADVIVFGGRPPYQISRPGTVTIDRDLVTQNGGRFTVTANGQCVESQPIAIVDSSGNTVTVTVSNIRGVGLTPDPIRVTPSSVTLNTCNQFAFVRVAGGTAPYFGSVGADMLELTQSVSTGDFGIRRRASTTATSTSAQVGFTDGRTTTQVDVTLAGQALGAC